MVCQSNCIKKKYALAEFLPSCHGIALMQIVVTGYQSHLMMLRLL
jgi:hypothetical protein